MSNDTRQWSQQTFGTATLGDARRVRRLIQIGARAAEKPHGRITQVFRSVREREGAYDFVENSAIDVEQLTQAISNGTAQEAAAYPFVFVPVDGTSLKLWDGTGRKDFGRVGSHTKGATGLKVINGLMISPEGVTLGVSGQRWWKRPLGRVRRAHHHCRDVDDKETSHWLHVIDQARDARSVHAPGTKLWFQLDREADSWTILTRFLEREDWFTVRSSSNRPLVGRAQRLHDFVRKAPVKMRTQVFVSSKDARKRKSARKERVAQLSVRAETVEVAFRERGSKKVLPRTLNIVHVRERGTTPKEEEPLQWFLLTNHPIETADDIRKVVFGYTQRWRVEDFHKTWKSGRCNVEENQLHSSEAVMRWATILAAVAARAEKLKHLSRTEPYQPASTQLSLEEVEALRLLRTEYGPLGEKQPRALDLETATRWIAELGGYTGRSSGGPPGTITIQRGLEQLRVASLVIVIKKRSEK